MSKKSDLEELVLQHVSQDDYKPVKPKIIAKQLGLSQEEAGGLRKAVKRLVKTGKLAYGPDHVVGWPTAADLDRITGVFRRVSGGHGYVRPAGAGPSHDKTQDIKIPAHRSKDASSGDVVLVRLREPKQSQHQGRQSSRIEGEIVEVLERETNQFVGTYYTTGGLPVVQVDGKVFSEPVLVGDPSARRVKVDDKVVIEMVRFPSQTHDGEAVIIEVLGPRGTPEVDTLSIIREYNLPGEFPADVLEQSRVEAENFDESIGENREDETDRTVITIDPIDARDFDDAISLEQIENGHWLLGVHIADVSHFVRPKTPLDREARDRATSVYLPDRVIPMIPEVISNNLASLQPNQVRYAKTAFIEFTKEGTVVGAEYQSSAIKSDRRFTYEEVDDYLEHRGRWKNKLTPEVDTLLDQMVQLARILRKRRFDRGSLELSMDEVKIDLDDDGHVCGAHRVINSESHQIIEEFMLAANEAVGNLLKDAEILFLRRVHAAPDPRKLKLLTEFVAGLGFKTESLESRFAIQKLLNEVKNTPQKHAVNYGLLRSLQQAIYSPMEEGHYALASDCYCHFTSPIRRYPDLTIHRLLDQMKAGRKPVADLNETVALGEHCSERSRRAEWAERELVKVKLLNYLESRIGEEMDGVVTGVEQFGLFVQGIELPAEGLIHISALQDDYYRYEKASHSLTGHRAGNSYRLGDYVRVAVARVDVDRRELDLRIVDRIDRPKQQTPDKPPRGNRQRGGGQAKSAKQKASRPKTDREQAAQEKSSHKKKTRKSQQEKTTPKSKSKSKSKSRPQSKPGATKGKAAQPKSQPVKSQPAKAKKSRGKPASGQKGKPGRRK